MSLRSCFRLLAVAILSPVLMVPLAGTATAAEKYPDRIELPDGFLPEGIAIGPTKMAYLGSRANGDIYEVNLRSGKGHVISKGPGTQSVGLKSDQRRRLYVAGGMAGDGRIVNIRTGKIAASYKFNRGESFVNDVVLTPRIAWFTDSRQAQLYAVPIHRKGGGASSKFITLPLTGDWVQAPGVNNANGIAVTPDGKALLVVQSNTGFLFRVNPRTGRATRVDLGKTVLTNGDGLLVKGRTLYAVQNQLNQVAVIKLKRSGRSGFLVRTLKSADFDVPTTIASFGKYLYLPNARFTTPQLPTTGFWITRIGRR